MARPAAAPPPAELTRLEGTDVEGSLAAWRDAAGLASLKPGACFSPADDRLFALGWPHVRFVVRGLRAEADPAGAAARLVHAPRLPFSWTWSRAVAERFVRVVGAPSVFELGLLERSLRPEALEGLWTEDPVTAVDAAALVSNRMAGEAHGLAEGVLPTFVLLLEALVGTEAVAQAIVDVLEAMPPTTVAAHAAGPAQLSFQLGFLLLRVPVPVAASLRERLHEVLRAVWAELPATRRGFAGASHARSLDLVLHGAAAAERSTDRSPRWYVHATDDAALVRRRVQVNRTGWQPDARIAWLAGPGVLRRFGRDLLTLGDAEEQRHVLQQLAPLAAPELLPLLLDIATSGAARAEATAWFAAHRDAAEPFLAASAPTVAPAAKALQRLRAPPPPPAG